MSLVQVAQKDFEDAARSKMLWGIVAVFVAFMAFVIVVTLNTSDAAEATSDGALRFVAQMGQLFVPLIALIAGYMSVVGERRTGSLRVLLGYPHSRRDVVFGKLLGRLAVIGVAVGLGSVITVLMVITLVGALDPVDVAAILGVIVLFGAAFTGLAVGISASVRSRGTAMALAIGSLLVFLMVWDPAVAGVYALVTGSLPGLEAEPWYFLLRRLSPIGAFQGLAESVVDGYIYPFIQFGVEDIPANTPPEQLLVEHRVAGDLPFYLSNWFAAATLAAWAVIPSVAGYLRFRGSDL